MRLWNAVAKPFKNIHRIFPTQQIEVGKMIDVCKKIPNVKRIVIFGSSVTPQCNPWSDIDIYFELASEMQKLPVVNITMVGSMAICSLEPPFRTYMNL